MNLNFPKTLDLPVQQAKDSLTQGYSTQLSLHTCHTANCKCTNKDKKLGITIISVFVNDNNSSANRP